MSDVAAEKEQTFGTLAARSMSWIGGKLHYGHSDFFNTLYMITRGGASKACISMQTFRIHRTRWQDKAHRILPMRKGDLGFGAIVNFQTKSGMNIYMLSRKHYYPGTQLPIARFLAFYYDHPGFMINNMLVILAVQVSSCISPISEFFVLMLLVFTDVFLGNLKLFAEGLPIHRISQFIGGQAGCYNLVPDFVLFAILVFFLTPLVSRSCSRYDLSSFMSVVSSCRIDRTGGYCASPFIFEVFSTPIGHGFAITRL